MLGFRIGVMLGRPVYGVNEAKSEVDELGLRCPENEKPAKEACTAVEEGVRVRLVVCPIVNKPVEIADESICLVGVENEEPDVTEVTVAGELGREFVATRPEGVGFSSSGPSV